MNNESPITVVSDNAPDRINAFLTCIIGAAPLYRFHAHFFLMSPGMWALAVDGWGSERDFGFSLPKNGIGCGETDIPC